MSRRPSARPAPPRPSEGEPLDCPRLLGRALDVRGRRIPMLSGAVHYWRLSPAHWRSALESVVRLGLPMVETYVPWGVHEAPDGSFDFGERDPQKDVGGFLDLAMELGLLAFVRPGPHINAEMTHFGVPERIIYDPACQARSPRGNPVILPFPPRMFPVPSYASDAYHAEVGRWYDAAARVLAPRLWPAGPIVLVQVDNEAAYYFRNGPNDQDYHPDAIALYRAFLAGRYGSPEAAGEAHRTPATRWDDLSPPSRFDAAAPADLTRHLDWAAFQEHLITHAIRRMRDRLRHAGLTDVPVVHNLPLGEGAVPVSLPALEEVVDVVGLDYYHARREHRVIKRRTLYLAGSASLPYAPELGVGAPPWFTPLGHDDSLFCALTACAYGLRGMNLYMAVDRDRWYGAPIDSRGAPRPEAATWQQLILKLRELGFHELERRVEVGLEIPREYGRLSRAAHVLGGMVSAANLEATGSSPVEASSEETFGFKGPIQVLWWRMLAKLADALTEAHVPYVMVDSDTPLDRVARLRVVVSPTFEFASPQRWARLADLAAGGTHVVFGPATPALDDRLTPARFGPIDGARLVSLDTPSDARALVCALEDALSLERPFPATPAPVETAVHHDGERPRVLFVIQPARAQVDCEVALPHPLELEDILTGERYRGDETVTIPMAGASVRAFELRTPQGAPTTAPRVAVRREGA